MHIPVLLPRELFFRRMQEKLRCRLHSIRVLGVQPIYVTLASHNESKERDMFRTMLSVVKGTKCHLQDDPVDDYPKRTLQIVRDMIAMK